MLSDTDWIDGAGKRTCEGIETKGTILHHVSLQICVDLGGQGSVCIAGIQLTT